MNSKSDDGKAPAAKAGRDKAANSDRDVGDALRAVYQDAISEKIPNEMLDLLNKLG